MLSVDLRYEPNRLVTHMLIDDKEFKKKVWEEQFDGHHIQQGKKMLLEQAIKFLKGQDRERPDHDDDLWKCSDESGNPLNSLRLGKGRQHKRFI